MRRATGFTLIELLIVFSILGLLVALVAPLTVKQVEKTHGQEDWLVLERAVEGLAFRAFAEGHPVTLRAEGAEIAWRVGSGEERIVPFRGLFFDPKQVIEIDAHGLAVPDELSVRQGDRARRLVLNGWLAEKP